MKRRGFLVLVLASSFSAVAAAVPLRAARAASQRYATRGVVRHVAKDRTRVRIRHEDIPGFMKAMTLPFDADPKLLAGVVEGDQVSFTFEARDDGSNVIVALARAAARSSTREGTDSRK